MTNRDDDQAPRPTIAEVGALWGQAITEHVEAAVAPLRAEIEALKKQRAQDLDALVERIRVLEQRDKW